MATDITINLKDANNNTVPIKSRQYDDGTVAFYHAFDARKRSVTTAAGTTTANNSVQVAPANAQRAFLTFQNKSTTNDMYVSENGAAASLTNGYRIPPAATAQVESSSAIFVFCVAAGQPFISSEGTFY